MSLAASTGINFAAISRVAVPTMRPAAPETMKVTYAFREILRLDSSANVVTQFMRYEAETATNHASKFARSGDNPNQLHATEKRPKSTSVLTAPTRAKLIAFCITRPFG